MLISREKPRKDDVWPDLFGFVPAVDTNYRPKRGRRPFNAEEHYRLDVPHDVVFEATELMELRSGVLIWTLFVLADPKTSDKVFAEALEWLLSDEVVDIDQNMSFRACLDAVDPANISGFKDGNWARQDDDSVQLDPDIVRRGVLHLARVRIREMERDGYDFGIIFDASDIPQAEPWSMLTISHQRVMREAKIWRDIDQSHY